ncbi:MAG: hypothetical protein SVU32_08505 [Candidatus Nanohaloarchaea archaeon]|nr:hypothetical protein [Candidatus Nanohaloarchaea archaeon]
MPPNSVEEAVFYIEDVDDALGTGTRLYTQEGLVAASRSTDGQEALVYRDGEGWIGKLRTEIGEDESAALQFTSYGRKLEEEYGFDEPHTARDFYQEKEDDIVELRDDETALLYVGPDGRLGSLPTDTGRSVAALLTTTTASAGTGFLGGLLIGGPTPVGFATGMAGLLGGAAAGIWDVNRGSKDRRSVSGSLYNLLQGDRVEDQYRLDNDSLIQRLNQDRPYDRLLDLFGAGPKSKARNLASYQCDFFAGMGGVTAAHTADSYQDAMAFITDIGEYDTKPPEEPPRLLDSEDALETVLETIDDEDALELARQYIEDDDLAHLDDLFDEHIDSRDDTLVLEV